MGDLLGEDYSLVEKNVLYRCLDRVLEHKEGLFSHLRQRWQDLFGARFEVLLYDLTSTYFESDPPFEESDKRQFGYSRDKRSDCVQVVIGLIVSPEGFPLAYEVLAGNTSDKTTLRAFLRKIEEQYGKAERIWVMDRGVPTEEVLSEMRSSLPVPVYYLVGTPKGRLSKLEADLLECPWQNVRAGVEVKVLPQEKELYILPQSRDRLNKERAMRRRQLKALWKRLAQTNVALEFAARHPEMSAAIVLIDSIILPQQAFRAALQRLPDALGVPDYRVGCQQAFLSLCLVTDDEAQKEQLIASLPRAPLEVLSSIVTNLLRDYDWLSQWKWRLQGQGVRSYHNYAVREVRKRGLPDHVFEHLLTMARRGR